MNLIKYAFIKTQHQSPCIYTIEAHATKRVVLREANGQIYAMQEKSIVSQLRLHALHHDGLHIKYAMCDPSRKHFNRCTSLDQKCSRVRSLPNKIQSISTVRHILQKLLMRSIKCQRAFRMFIALELLCSVCGLGSQCSRSARIAGQEIFQFWHIQIHTPDQSRYTSRDATDLLPIWISFGERVCFAIDIRILNYTKYSPVCRRLIDICTINHMGKARNSLTVYVLVDYISWTYFKHYIFIKIRY